MIKSFTKWLNSPSGWILIILLNIFNVPAYFIYVRPRLLGVILSLYFLSLLIDRVIKLVKYLKDRKTKG